MRVLVVEDEPLIRLLAVDILEAAGFAVTDASSVAAALLAAGDERFDAAVIDLGTLAGCTAPEPIRSGGYVAGVGFEPT